MLDGRSQIRRRAGLRLWLSGGWLLLLVLIAIFAPLISPHDPLEQDLFLGRMPPFWVQGAEPGYYLGTDSLGRDVLARILKGAQVSLLVGLTATVLNTMVALLVGGTTGFIGDNEIDFTRADLKSSFAPFAIQLWMI